MQLIKKITDSDMLGGTPHYLDSVSRYGSRGVLLDDTSKIAMMYMSKTNLYKLPGGGIDDGEEILDAFIREIKEETGFEAEVIHELGYIEEHKNKNNFMQCSYCFIAKVSYNSIHCNTTLTESEKQLGMMVKWLTLNEALKVMSSSVNNCDDYSTKFMILRDKTILECAVNSLCE